MNSALLTLATFALVGAPLTAGIQVPAQSKGSAYLTGQSQSAYLNSLKQRLLINSSEQDAFGLPQDPPRVQVDDNALGHPDPSPASLKDVLETLKIVMINPGDNTFMVGSRIFHVNEEFPLFDGDREIQLKVISVGAAAVVFEDLKTGESARLSFKLAPQPLPAPGTWKGRLPDGIETAKPQGTRGTPFRVR